MVVDLGERARRRFVAAVQRAHERGLDAEDRVAVEVLAVGVEHVRGHRQVPVSRDDEVDVRRPPGVAPERAEHPSGRAVVGNRIGDRPHRPEVVAAVRVGANPAAQVVLGLAGVLHVVEPGGRGLPDVDHGTG